MKPLYSLVLSAALTVTSFGISSAGPYFKIPFGISSRQAIALYVTNVDLNEMQPRTSSTNLFSMFVGDASQTGVDMALDFYQGKLFCKSYRYVVTDYSEDDIRSLMYESINALSETYSDPQYYFETEFDGTDMNYTKYAVGNEEEEAPHSDGDLDLIWSLAYGHLYMYNSAMYYTFQDESAIGYCGFFVDDDDAYFICSMQDKTAVVPALEEYLNLLDEQSAAQNQ